MNTERDVMVEALQHVAQLQPDALAMIERNGFVFADIGREPGNWQHLAFSLYTDLCEADHIARSALEIVSDLALSSQESPTV